MSTAQTFLLGAIAGVTIFIGLPMGRMHGLSSIALTGFVVGLMSLVYYDTWMKARRRKAMLGPGAASVAEFAEAHKPGLSAAQWLSVFIATGIGLHNFS